MGNLDNLNLAYAMTVHKAQGGQCEAAIMPLTTSHTHMLERSILYTGVNYPALKGGA